MHIFCPENILDILGTEQNIFIRLNKLTEFTTHKKIITGRQPEKPCGSTMLATPTATYTNNQYMKNRQVKQASIVRLKQLMTLRFQTKSRSRRSLCFHFG